MMMVTVVVKVMKMTTMIRDFVPTTKLRSASTKPDRLHSKSADNVRSHRDPSTHTFQKVQEAFSVWSFLPSPPPPIPR